MDLLKFEGKYGEELCIKILRVNTECASVANKGLKGTEMINVNACHAEYFKMPCPLLSFSRSDYLIQVVDTNSFNDKECSSDQLASSEAN